MKLEKAGFLLFTSALVLAGSTSHAQWKGWFRQQRPPVYYPPVENNEVYYDDEQQAPQQQRRTQPKQKVSCEDFTRRNVTIDGQVQQRFVVSDAKYRACLPKQPKAPWVVMKDQWDGQDEINWQNFLKSIGNSKCNTLDTCLVSNANPYRDDIDVKGFHYADCADFPMYMRAYFSFKNKLPFSMVYSFEPNALSNEQLRQVESQKRLEEQKGTLDKYEKSLNDIRYSLNGNRPTSRFSVPQSNGAGRDFFEVATNVANMISSGSYRMFHTNSDIQPDFYSPIISRDSIRPGTVLYKVTGHVALVYEITQNGDVKYIDAHPDNSITRGTFSREYMRSNPFQGGGFKNWRPMKVASVTKKNDGSLFGRIAVAKDEQIADFSAEQYYGNAPDSAWDWKKGKFQIKGREVSYYDYIRVRLTEGDFKLNPVAQLKQELTTLCTDLQERTESVRKAIEDKIHQRSHPSQYPLNIYGADGEWESYSTPGRDLRVRKAALDIIDNVRDYMQKQANKDPYFEYKGENLKRDLILTYHEADAACRVAYVNSQGKDVRMSLSTALNRITRLSFDPYLCPERRWGAKSAAELRSCAETADKTQWYEFTQFLRNQVIRDPMQVMGYTLNDVKQISKVQAEDAKENSSRFNILKALQEL